MAHVKLSWLEIPVEAPPTKKHRKQQKQEKLPRIVLHGVVGQELDTDTVYQQRIMELRQRQLNGLYPQDPEQWRLPHSPVPARPDFSRDTGPRTRVGASTHTQTERLTRKERQLKQSNMTKWESLPSIIECADKDQKRALAKLSFNIGQLETLPPLVAAALFHESLGAPNSKAYVPFVSSAPVHSKSMSGTDRREPHWEAPGLCYGCARQQLCYGCVKDPFKPHYHSDKPMRTGGGFSYFRRDKPLEPSPDKSPLNWRAGTDPTSYIYYDGFIDFDRYDLTMKTGLAPFRDRTRDLDELLLHHARMHSSHHPPLPSIKDSEAYKGRPTTPLSDGDSGRGGTVADSQENLQRELERMGDTVSGIAEESSSDQLMEEHRRKLRQGKGLSLSKPVRTRLVMHTNVNPIEEAVDREPPPTEIPRVPTITVETSEATDKPKVEEASVEKVSSSIANDSVNEEEPPNLVNETKQDKPATATPPTKPSTSKSLPEPIFKDGTIILRDGTVLKNATILSDGSIRLKNGKILENMTVVLDDSTILTDAKIMKDGTIFKDGRIVNVGRIVKDGTVLSDGTVVKGKKDTPPQPTPPATQKTPSREEPVEAKEKATPETVAPPPSQENVPEKSVLELLREQMEERRKQSPKAFTPKKNSKPATVAKSPFSQNRVYDLPSGDGFTVHKSDKPTTQFEDFDRLDHTWNEPDRFDLKSAGSRTQGMKSRRVAESGELEKRCSGGSGDKPDTATAPTKLPSKDPTPSPPEKRASSADSGHDSQLNTTRTEEEDRASRQQVEVTLPQMSSVPPSRAPSTLSRVHTRPPSGQDLTVEGEGTFIARGETPASRAQIKRADSIERAESRSHSRVSSRASAVVKVSSPEIPDTIESRENTTLTEPKPESPPKEEEIVEEPVKEPTPSPPTPKDPTPAPTPPQTEPDPPKAAEIDWNKFRSGAVAFNQEEERKTREAEEEEKRRREEEEAQRLREEEARRLQESENAETAKKREVVKKEAKKDKKRPKRKQKAEKAEPTEPEPEPQTEPDPEPEPEPEVVVSLPPLAVVEKPRSPTPPPPRRVEPPPLPRLEPPYAPELPEYGNPERPVRDVSKTLIEAPPPMPEPPKQRRPADLKRVPKRRRERNRLLPTAQNVAPVSKGALKEITDPLDYLGKYCIIHPDRLPHYERIFNTIIAEQVYRYNDVPHPPGHSMESQLKRAHEAQENSTGGSPTTAHATTDAAPVGESLTSCAPQPKTTLTMHERKMMDDLNIISRATNPKYGLPGMNEGDQLVAKINFTLDMLIDNYEHLQDKMDELFAERLSGLASAARKEFPEVCKPSFKPKEKKTKKSKSKKDKKASAPDLQAAVDMETQTETTESVPEITDALIVSRLDDKQLAMLESDQHLSALGAEIGRMQIKLKEVDDRIEDLEDEQKLFKLYARDLFTERHAPRHDDPRRQEFMRRQSALYRKLHPNINAEMNLTELEEALQQLNQHLISEKELQYIYHILDIDGRRRIDIQLFTVIAALSEKVAQVDPFIRKLINKFDFEALDVKMEKSKELFDLLDDKEFDVPAGMIKAKTLVVALAAGGIAPENSAYVENKFNREKQGIVDFLDFLTYVPLFIEIHQRIIDNPLNYRRDM